MLTSTEELDLLKETIFNAIANRGAAYEAEYRPAVLTLSPEVEDLSLKGFTVRTLEEMEHDALVGAGAWRCCTICERVLDADCFYVERPRGKIRLTQRCRDCLKAKLRAAGKRRRAGGTLDYHYDRAKILARANGICQICRKPIRDRNWHVDHRVPISLGGIHAPENFQPAHAECNIRKGGRNRTPPKLAAVYDRAAARGQLVLL